MVDRWPGEEWSHPSRSMSGMRLLIDHASANHGIFDLATARTVEVGKDRLAHAIDRGEIVRLHRGVYRFAAVPPTWESEVLAGCFAGGGRAFASHRTAAALHDLPGGSRKDVEITCPRWRRKQHNGLVVHESKYWTSRDQTVVDGIPVASAALTLLHLAQSLSWNGLERALENALRRELTTLDDLDDLLRRYARRGRPGIRKLRSLVRSRMNVMTPTDSERETLLLQVIRRRGLAEPVRQFRVFDGGREIGRVDLAYPDARITIEYDSDSFHTGRVATAKDSRRRHEMIAAGWLPITAVNQDLLEGGHYFCRALETALRDRTSGPVPASVRRT